MKSPITIDFVNATITVNAAYAKKASNPFSAEYAQIQKVRADYPTFTVRTRSIKKNAAKDSYKGLTYDYMRAYIMSHEKGEDRVNALMEFDELLLISQCHSKGRRYPVIKSWFHDNYPEIKNFGMIEMPGFEIVPKDENKVADFPKDEKVSA